MAKSVLKDQVSFHIRRTAPRFNRFIILNATHNFNPQINHLFNKSEYTRIWFTFQEYIKEIK